jgi:hypothetical protein
MNGYNGLLGNSGIGIGQFRGQRTPPIPGGQLPQLGINTPQGMGPRPPATPPLPQGGIDPTQQALASGGLLALMRNQGQGQGGIAAQIQAMQPNINMAQATPGMGQMANMHQAVTDPSNAGLENLLAFLSRFQG